MKDRYGLNITVSRVPSSKSPEVKSPLVVKHFGFVKEKIKLLTLLKDLSEVQIGFVPHQ